MNAHVPIIKYDEAHARRAWAEYLLALEEEKVAHAKRVRAHQRFMAAFMGGEA